MKITHINKIAVRQQQGATLIVALVLLGVMSVLAASTMTSSTLQERMANNSRQKFIATAAAESALREAEQWLSTTVDDTGDITNHFLDGPTTGCYSDREVPVLARIVNRTLSSNISDVSSDNAWLTDTSTSRSVSDINSDWEDGDWARTPRIVIELLGQMRGDELSGVQNLDDVSQSHNEPWVFRITAIGWSKNPDIYSVLQSTYTTGRQFGG